MKSNLDSSTDSNPKSDSDGEFDPLRCWDCNLNFTSKHFLYSHLIHHVKQPRIILNRAPLPSLKLTLKNNGNGKSFHIINSPSDTSKQGDNILKTTNLAENQEVPVKGDGEGEDTTGTDPVEAEETKINFSPNYVENYEGGSVESPPNEEGAKSQDGLNSEGEGNTSDYGSIPGGEPTPSPEPSPDYPKIRIKNSELMRQPLTITEITDENPTGDPDQSANTSAWNNITPNDDDPLKLPENDDNNLLSLFNNNEKAKDYGFHTSDEFIPLDRLEDRNQNAMQLYNPTSTSQNQSPLDSLTGLPMQALAHQVSRLHTQGSGMHQQNVLINIQQFPSGPPQPPYQPPPMYPPHYPPHQPMHQPYQYPPHYRPPNPMYPHYAPAPPPGYPPQHMAPPPPQPQMRPSVMPVRQQQMAPHQQMPVSSASQQPNANANPMQRSSAYRQPLPPRQPAPHRQQASGARMPQGGGARPPVAVRQAMHRQRAPMMRPRGAAASTGMRGARPRMATPQNNVRQPQAMKRTPEQVQQLQQKKRRFDMLVPEKDDDDCQVICMQPKNMDGGLPQIESVQGGTAEPAESSIMHLSDSITLSVRNPPPKPQSPKKSDAKAVANILATRGITVTATPKPKDKNESQSESSKTSPPSLPPSLNLNGAVSIIPSAKTNSTSNGSNKPSPTPSSNLPTVDLTDDTSTPPANPQPKAPSQKPRPGLPYRCDLCAAQYPNALGLSKHRQTYHKTTEATCELGIPLVNLKQPGIFQRLSSLGIHNYVPLPSSGSDGMFGLPIINAKSPGNLNAIGATKMLSLGPVRTIPKPQGRTPQGNANGAANGPQRQPPNQKT